MSNAPIDVDTAFLEKYQESINEVFRIYHEDINPFIVQFEILKNEFPIEIQNEIRAIYGHLVRASIADNDKDVERNIAKMRSHTKRALFDCFKYSCILISDKYHAFFERYRGIDLTYINKGHFSMISSKDIVRPQNNCKLQKNLSSQMHLKTSW